MNKGTSFLLQCFICHYWRKNDFKVFVNRRNLFKHLFWKRFLWPRAKKNSKLFVKWQGTLFDTELRGLPAAIGINSVFPITIYKVCDTVRLQWREKLRVFPFNGGVGWNVMGSEWSFNVHTPWEIWLWRSFIFSTMHPLSNPVHLAQEKRGVY